MFKKKKKRDINKRILLFTMRQTKEGKKKTLFKIKNERIHCEQNRFLIGQRSIMTELPLKVSSKIVDINNLEITNIANKSMFFFSFQKKKR